MPPFASQVPTPKVFVTGRKRPELTAATEQIGQHAVGIQGNVSKLEHLDRLFTGSFDKSRSALSRPPVAFSIEGVTTGPGLTTFTRVRRSLSSFAHVRAKLLTAALLAFNTPNPGIPLIVHMEAFRTTAAPSGITPIQCHLFRP